MDTSWPPRTNSLTSKRPMNNVPPITSSFFDSGWSLFFTDSTLVLVLEAEAAAGIRCLSYLTPQRYFRSLIVVLQPEVRDEILSLHPTESVLQFHQLNKYIVFRVQTGRRHRTLEVERQPFLNTLQFCSPSEIQEKH